MFILLGSLEGLSGFAARRAAVAAAGLGCTPTWAGRFEAVSRWPQREQGRRVSDDAGETRANPGSRAAAPDEPGFAELFARHERDVHRPVGAGRLGELAGAVERVDDPDPLGGEAGRMSGAGSSRAVDAGLVLSALRRAEVVGPEL